MKPKSYRRGYPVAILVGVEVERAFLWQIFSQVAKHQQTLTLAGDRRDQKALYNFHESIVNALRPILKEGVRSVIVASSQKTSFAQEFLSHIKSHHTWLLQGQNKVSFSQIPGSVSTPQHVAALTKTVAFKQLVSETTTEETENLLETLEKRLNDASNLVFFSLSEAESLILNNQVVGKPAPEYLLLTNEYLSGSRQRNRVHRLVQVASNKKVKTRIIDSESNAGKRVTQLGGIVCLAKIES
jgi:stalled ribosome rescue protein Dom34